MTLLNKESIFAAPDLKTERLTVDEWGGEIIVSEMGGQTAFDFYEYVMPAENGDDSSKISLDARFKAALVAFCVVDEQGQPLFTAQDIPRLARKKAAVLNKVFQVADRLNLITDAARAEVEKNSLGEGAGVEPCSSSPETSASLPGGTSSKR